MRGGVDGGDGFATGRSQGERDGGFAEAARDEMGLGLGAGRTGGDDGVCAGGEGDSGAVVLEAGRIAALA